MSVERKNVSLGRTSTDIVLGRSDYSDWTDEELLRGQRKSRRGRWEGKPPLVVPMALLHEQNRRRCSEAIRDLQDTVADAVAYVRSCVRGEVEPNNTRLQAAIVVMNRVLGPERIQLEIAAHQPSEYELAGVTRAIIKRDFVDLESEEVDPDLGPEDDDPFGFNEPDEPERKTERRRRRRDSRKEQSAAEETDERAHTANYPMRWHKDEQSPPKR